MCRANALVHHIHSNARIRYGSSNLVISFTAAQHKILEKRVSEEHTQSEAKPDVERALAAIIEVRRPIRMELPLGGFTAMIPQIVIGLVVLGILFALGSAVYSHFAGPTYSPGPYQYP